MEVGSTSRAKKRKKNEVYCIRMKTCNVEGPSTLELDSEEYEMAVNVVSTSREGVLHEARQSVVQQATTVMSRETKLV